MKKILFLGGGALQIAPIIKAKELGYYTITCDYLPENPGHKYSDEYHNVSTTDKEGVLRLAKQLKIDGIVSYASDVSASTAAYVAESLGLPTSPYKSVEILTHKDLFRSFLEKNGFNTPKSRSYSYSEINLAEENIVAFNFPVIVKPTDSSGSKGVRKIQCVDEFKTAAVEAVKYSRSKRFIVEEFVDKVGYQVDGDGFSIDGKLVFRCFGNQHNDLFAENPYVPSGISFPYYANIQVQQKIHDELQRALQLLDMKNSAYNFEVRIDENENIWIMEIGPRNGGNLIPEVIRYATGVDLIEYTVKSACGEDCSALKMVEPNGCFSSYILHAANEGILKEIWIDDCFKKDNVIEYKQIRNFGEKVHGYNGESGCVVGVMILKFKNMTEMLEKMDHMDKYINVKVY